MPLEHTQDEVIAKAKKALRLPDTALKNMQVVRQSVDAREKNNIIFVYSVEAEVETVPSKLPNNISIVADKKLDITRGGARLTYPPVIIGAGPAGLFAAWKLAEWGFKPLVLERGKDVLSRHTDVVHFWETGELDPNSNVQFGEGGAGTFSDGKLTARTKDYRINEVFEILVACGAPAEIMYMQKPHIGTDVLRNVVINIRKKIQENGGTVLFNNCLTGIDFSRQQLTGVKINNCIDLPAQLCLLAIGHSARDTYAMLAEKNLQMQAKSFAVGLRVEHSQHLINSAQHGEFAGHPALGAADYALTYQDSSLGRGIFSFCMCPGGHVVAAASEEGGVVTNGMSEHARDSKVANSAVVVSVSPEDFPNDGVLSGIDFQRFLEKTAFKQGGGNYFAPASNVDAFIEDRAELSINKNLYPTYKPGVTEANLRDLLPKEVGQALANALENFERKITNFSQATLTGVESRTSAPVRIIRTEDMQSPDVSGLYPIGEGAGYAGGIVSAAIDGLKAAEKIIAVFNIPNDDFSANDLTKLRELN